MAAACVTNSRQRTIQNHDIFDAVKPICPLSLCRLRFKSRYSAISKAPASRLFVECAVPSGITPSPLCVAMSSQLHDINRSAHFRRYRSFRYSKSTSEKSFFDGSTYDQLLAKHEQTYHRQAARFPDLEQGFRWNKHNRYEVCVQVPLGCKLTNQCIDGSDTPSTIKSKKT